MRAMLTKAVLCAAVSVALVLASGANAKNYKVLHTFKGDDGKWPQSEMIADGAGNLYGVAPGGGIKAKHSYGGYGVVFEIQSDGAFTLLHKFQGGNDGDHPIGRANVG